MAVYHSTHSCSSHKNITQHQSVNSHTLSCSMFQSQKYYSAAVYHFTYSSSSHKILLNDSLSFPTNFDISADVSFRAQVFLQLLLSQTHYFNCCCHKKYYSTCGCHKNILSTAAVTKILLYMRLSQNTHSTVAVTESLTSVPVSINGNSFRVRL